MDHFAVVIAASRKALLEATDHQKVAQALAAVGKKLMEADADAARVVQLKEELAAADQKAANLVDGLDRFNADSAFYETAFSLTAREILMDSANDPENEAELSETALAIGQRLNEADEAEVLIEALRRRLARAGIEPFGADSDDEDPPEPVYVEG